MTALALWDDDSLPDTPEPVPPAHPRLTERDMLDLLHRRGRFGRKTVTITDRRLPERAA